MSRIAPPVIVLAAALCGLPPLSAQHTTGIQSGLTNPGDQEVPLLEAHQDLLLARARMAEQNYAATVASLDKAENALADFEKQDHGPLGQQADFMRQDIATYALHVGRDASIDPIDAWIQTIEAWKGNSKNPLEPPSPW